MLDLDSKEIVGWVMSCTPNPTLANEAIKMAIKKKQPNTTKLLFHSDQGV